MKPEKKKNSPNGSLNRRACGGTDRNHEVEGDGGCWTKGFDGWKALAFVF